MQSMKDYGLVMVEGSINADPLPPHKELNMSLSAPKMTTFGTCQICGATHQTYKNGRIARHGWRAASFHGHTRHTQDCAGSSRLPLEMSRDALIAHAAEVATYNTKKNDPRELLSYLAQLLDMIKNWQPKELTQAPIHTPEPSAPKAGPAPKPEPKPGPKPEPKPEPAPEPKPELSKMGQLKQIISADPYTVADADNAPQIELITLKSDAQRLKAAHKLSAGDLVLVPLRRVDSMGWLEYQRPNWRGEFLPARILKTNKRGQATAWAYVGDPLHNGQHTEPLDEIKFYGYLES